MLLNRQPIVPACRPCSLSHSTYPVTISVVTCHGSAWVNPMNSFHVFRPLRLSWTLPLARRSSSQQANACPQRSSRSLSPAAESPVPSSSRASSKSSVCFSSLIWDQLPLESSTNILETQSPIFLHRADAELVEAEVEVRNQRTERRGVSPVVEVQIAATKNPKFTPRRISNLAQARFRAHGGAFSTCTRWCIINVHL